MSLVRLPCSDQQGLAERAFGSGDKFDTVEDENAVQPWYLCGTPCAGFREWPLPELAGVADVRVATENCGGWESMTVFKKSSGGSSTPSGWSYLNVSNPSFDILNK